MTPPGTLLPATLGVGLLGLRRLSDPVIAWPTLAIGALGGFANLAIRRPAPPATTHASR